MRRRTLTAALGCFAVAWPISGCIVMYDAPKPEVGLDNKSDEDVIVYVEGDELRFETAVRGGTFGALGTNECQGTAIVVETGDGEPVGRVEEPACPGWTLTINGDGGLDYTEN